MNVLVAIDGSNYGDEILAQIVTRAWPEGSEFHVVTVVESCTDWETAQIFEHQGRIILDQRMAALKKSLAKYHVTGEVITGHPAVAITEAAQQWGTHLIIIGSHADTKCRRKEIGSVAAAVVNQAQCSVEVVKSWHKAGHPIPSQSAVML